MYTISRCTSFSLEATRKCLVPKNTKSPLFTKLTEDHFIKILKKTNLISLDVSHSSVSDGVAKAIVDHCPNLKRFTAKDTTFKKRIALSFFSSIPNVTYLDLSCTTATSKFCRDLTEQALKLILMNCKSLQHLNLAENRKVTGLCFGKHLPISLKYLNISNTLLWILWIVRAFWSCLKDCSGQRLRKRPP